MTEELKPMSLRDALRDSPCPRPANDQPADQNVGACVDKGLCGCQNGNALAAVPAQGAQCKNCRHRGCHLAWRCDACGFNVDLPLPVAPAQGQPSCWQWRSYIGGRWTDWQIVKGDIEVLKNSSWKFNFDNGTAEVRPLYTAPPAEGTPTKEDFAKWCRVWHDTCDTILEMLGLPGHGSPAEAIDKVSHYLAGRPSPAASDSGSDLTKIAAECHRAKWQFDVNDEMPLSAKEGRTLAARAFEQLHRIGDLALKMRDEARGRSQPETITQDKIEAVIAGIGSADTAAEQAIEILSNLSKLQRK